VVIDWGFAARGHPAADVARTRLIVEVGERPPGSSSLVGLVDPLGRRLLSHAYMRAYRKTAPLDLALVDQWRPLVALARVSAGIPEERERIIEIFEMARAPVAHADLNSIGERPACRRPTPPGRRWQREHRGLDARESTAQGHRLSDADRRELAGARMEASWKRQALPKRPCLFPARAERSEPCRADTSLHTGRLRC
jgi:hypothetical protein